MLDDIVQSLVSIKHFIQQHLTFLMFSHLNNVSLIQPHFWHGCTICTVYDAVLPLLYFGKLHFSSLGTYPVVGKGIKCPI